MTSGSMTGLPSFKKVVIGSDHGGFGMKEMLKAHISAAPASKPELVDVGCHSPDRCDYPDIAVQILSESQKSPSDTLSVFVCGSGIGISIAANKAQPDGPGCCLLHDVTTAKYAREVRKTNSIALGGRTTGDAVAKEILDVFLA